MTPSPHNIFFKTVGTPMTTGDAWRVYLYLLVAGIVATDIALMFEMWPSVH